MSNQIIETSHGSIAFIDTAGTGVPVVMIHANSVCKESFKPQISALAGLRRVIAFDLPGHGASGNAVDPKCDHVATVECRRREFCPKTRRRFPYVPPSINAR